MGKHSGHGDASPGTDAGNRFDQMNPAEKAAEFDASVSDPQGYAERNFGAGQSKAEQWSSARAEQREQQKRNQ